MLATWNGPQNTDKLNLAYFRAILTWIIVYAVKVACAVFLN